MTYLEVYDSVNKHRLLGTMEVPERIQGMIFRAPVVRQMPPIDFFGTRMVCDEIETVTFHMERRQKSERHQTSFYTSHVLTEEWTVLETKTPLEVLMDVRGFRLPGETNSKAVRRHHGSLY